VFSTKGINNLYIETSEMKMMKPKKVITPIKKAKTPKKKTPTKKDEIIEK
jgi:hypothetical protein